MNNQIQLRKSNGEGFKSKNSAINAFKKFKELNNVVFSAQHFAYCYIELPNMTYEILIESETDSIWAAPLADNSRVLYRTVSDLKYDRPMLDGRPKPKTEREAALEAELDALKSDQSPDLRTNTVMVMEDDDDGLEAMAQAFEDYKREMEEKVSELKQELAQTKAELTQAKEIGKTEILIQLSEWAYNNKVDRDYHLHDQYTDNLIEQYKRYSSRDSEEDLDAKKEFEDYLRIELACYGRQLGLDYDQYLLDLDEAFKIIIESNKPLSDDEKKELDASFEANDEPVDCFATTNIALAEGTELTVDDLF